ncbi:hypothetical protein B5V00_05815 [Geothermobacter hydrogeniphilus]|uniref:Demethylmenaquinone methyltransferase / 2-methoxy-6-polyprenyl-1,4-benzoquinol methylase n=2 Tax=Geothermobacter hydrogeniphilus TaxID=1969733 RepID=A0A1X0Y952_9BACT|nr:hypothetical protein B5V00_05815 [Geothermobacter hydrogeniphilus]
MRKALTREKIQDIYSRLAAHYDTLHRLLTAGADQRGRRMLVEKTITSEEKILDCGAGTGSCGLLAAKMSGATSHVILLDLNETMLRTGRKKTLQEDLTERTSWLVGDMTRLPFPDNSFDLVFSSYSLCPLTDPRQGALELYRVTRPGGKIAVAHSTEAENPFIHWAADKIETLAWRYPILSMGCRPVSVLPALERAGAKLLFRQRIGVPLWPFLIFIMKKPQS